MRPIHPGEICVKKFLMALEMSAQTLSQAIHVPATRVNDVVNGKRGVTADTALRLDRYFGNSPEFWLNLHAAAEREAAARIRARGVAARGGVTCTVWHSDAAQADEIRVNHSGSVALSAEEVRGPRATSCWSDWSDEELARSTANRR